MELVTRMKRSLCVVLVLVFAVSAFGAMAEPEARTEEEKLIEEQQQAAAKVQREAAEKAGKIGDLKMQAWLPEQVDQLTLLEDTTQRLEVREIRISQNTLISTAEIFEDMPLVFNASDEPLLKAPSDFLFDLRPIHEVVDNPGQPHQVSARTIQGFTQYILALYLQNNYAGVYIYVPREAISQGKLAEGVLTINILEAQVSEVAVRSYDVNGVEKEKGYLHHSAVEKWSPVMEGGVVNQKKLNDFVNLLNLNPDRYVSALVSQGAEPNSLAVAYDIYEINPWHYFIQIDNAGTEERQWSPRVGLINTDLLGFDDTFTAMFQTKPDSTFEDNYSVYGSYDFPVMGPRLRLNLYAGYSEFDVNPDSGPFNFLGRGQVYGGYFRLNVFQQNLWFFDLLAGMSYEESRNTPSLFGDILGTDLFMSLWNVGAEVHRDTDVATTSFAFNRSECFHGSSDDEFNLARTGVSSEFAIYNASMFHRQYLDPNEISRVNLSFRFIGSNDRLPPAKMTTFGGMYTVRGYGENEIVADGGYLGSLQYEYDLIRASEAAYETQPLVEEEIEQQPQPQPFLRKLAPLVFLDAAKAHDKSPLQPAEKRNQCLVSVGGGLAVELGDNFSGAVYYGYPLRETEGTREGKGRVNVGMMMRW